MSKLDFIIFTVIVTFICATLGFGIYACYEYANRDKFPPQSACGTFGNITSMTMKKKVFKLWSWEYESDVGFFKQRCPTFTHDADIYDNNNNLISRTDGKIFSLTTRYNIYDCFGNTKYIVETGNFFEAVINTNRIWVSLLLRDKSENVIGFIDSEIFVDGSVNLKDLNGTIIANMAKTFDPFWQWTYNIYSNSNTVVDMDCLVAITSKLSFMPGIFEKKDKTDICNQFFLGASITAVI